jgi:hypothetical protein
MCDEAELNPPGASGFDYANAQGMNVKVFALSCDVYDDAVFALV